MKSPGLKVICATIGCILCVYVMVLVLSPLVTTPTQEEHKLRREFPQVNFNFVDPTFTPRELTNEGAPFVLIIVSSAGWPKFKFRRDAVRRTWGKRAVQAREIQNLTATTATARLVSHWKTVFLFGRTRDDTLDSRVEAEGAEHNDIVVGNFTEAYDNLVIKVFMGIRWALTTRCRYILKADDDVYIRVPRILEWLANAPERLYAGHVHQDVPVNHDPYDETSGAVDPKVYAEKRFPPYCLGAFYVVSASILPDLFDAVKLWKPWIIEDTYVGVLARQIGVRPAEIDGLLLKSSMGESLGKTDCELAQTRALGHQLTPPHLYLLHRRFQVLEERLGGKGCVCVTPLRCLLLYCAVAVTLSAISASVVLYISSLKRRSKWFISITNSRVRSVWKLVEIQS